MNVKNVLFAAILICMTAAMVSCNKESSPNDPYADPKPCQHDSLFFVAGAQATDSTCGSIEHYECAVCHAMFIDKACTKSIDNDVIWADSYVFGGADAYESLDGIKGEIDAECRELAGPGESFSFSVIGTWLFKKVLEPKLVDMLKSLFAFHDNKGQGKTISPEAKAIVSQLANIENQLKRIADYFQDKEINEIVDKRQYELQALRASTDPDFDILLDLIEGYSEKDVLPQEKIDSIELVVDEWYYHGISYVKEVFRSPDPYDNIHLMLEYINGTWSSSRKFPELYDHIAHRSTPWANEGNNLREAMRAVDIMSITKAYIMLSLYYKFNPTALNTRKYNTIKGLMTNYCKCMETFEVNPVENNVIRWWWQDKSGGSKLHQYALDKAIFHFEYLESNLDKAIAEKYSFKEDYAGGLWRITEENIPVGSFLEYNDYKLLYKYLEDSKTPYGDQKTLYEGIQSMGFTGLIPFKNGGRIVYRSGSHQFCGPRTEEKSEGYADYLFFSARSNVIVYSVLCLETALDEKAKRMERYNNVAPSCFYRQEVGFDTYNPIPRVFRVNYMFNKGKRTGIQIQGISRSATVKPYQPYVVMPKAL